MDRRPFHGVRNALRIAPRGGEPFEAPKPVTVAKRVSRLTFIRKGGETSEPLSLSVSVLVKLPTANVASVLGQLIAESDNQVTTSLTTQRIFVAS